MFKSWSPNPTLTHRIPIGTRVLLRRTHASGTVVEQIVDGTYGVRLHDGYSAGRVKLYDATDLLVPIANPSLAHQIPIGTRVAIRSGNRVVAHGVVVEHLPRGQYDGTYGVRVTEGSNAGWVEPFFAKDLLVLRPSATLPPWENARRRPRKRPKRSPPRSSPSRTISPRSGRTSRARSATRSRT